MEKEEIIYLATKAFDKRWNYEQVKYGDDLYGHESDIDPIWEYVIELEEIGRKAFYEKYKNYKLY